MSGPLTPTERSDDSPCATTERPKPLRGWVSTYYVRQGAHRFGPYHVRVWKENGKTHKQYIKPGDLQQIIAACQAHRNARKESARITSDFTNSTRNLNWLQRMCQRLQKGAIREEDWTHLRVIEQHGITSPGCPKLRLARRHQTWPLAYHPIEVQVFGRQPSHIEHQAFSVKDQGASIENRAIKNQAIKNQTVPLMVPLFTKSQMKRAIQRFDRFMDHVAASETLDQKQSRWQKELDDMPQAAKPPFPLPDWITEEEFARMIEDIASVGHAG